MAIRREILEDERKKFVNKLSDELKAEILKEATKEFTLVDIKRRNEEAERLRKERQMKIKEK